VDVAADKVSDTVAVSGAIYRLAQAGLSSGTLNLGRIHSGSTFQAGVIQVTNIASGDGFSDLLRVSPVLDGSGLLVSGTSQTLQTSETLGLSVGYNVSPGTVGLVSGTLSLGMTSVGKVGTGLADVALSSLTVNVFGQVYSGRGIWTGNSGAWTDLANWATDGGSPGLDGILSRGVDSAVFASSTPLSVQLPAQSVELARLELLGVGGVRLTAASGGGGVLSFSGAAQIQASGGSHVVEAPIGLALNTSVTVDDGAKLTLGGVLSGQGGITKLGGGTLFLGAVNSYTGETRVSAGRLELGVGALPGSGTITLGVGAQLVFNLTSDLTLSNTILGGGVVLSLNSPYRVFWNGGGSTEPTGAGSVHVGQGEVTDLWSSLISGDGVLGVFGGTLRVSETQVVSNPTAIRESASFAIMAGGTLTLSGNVSGDGTLRKESTGTLTLSGSNTYSGGTEVTGGILEVQTATALGTAGVRIGAAGQLVLNSGSLANMTVSNSVSGPGELLKTGAGTVTLTGVNDQELGTRLKDGILSVNNGMSLGRQVTLDGGSLLLSGSMTVSQPVTLASAGRIAVDGKVVLNGTLSGPGDLTKSGTGSLTLSGSGSLQGRTVVQQGTLTLTNAQTLSRITTLVVGNAGADQGSTILDVRGIAGGLQLADGQTLKGRGVLIGNVGLTGATLAPGNSIDVQRLQGNLTLTNSVYEVEYTTLGGGKSDRFEVSAGGGFSGTVTLNGATVVPTAQSALTDFAQHRFTILKAEGGVDGRFAGISQTALVRSRLIYGDETPLPAGAVEPQVLAIDMVVQRISAESVGGYGSLLEVGRGVDLLLGTTQPEFSALLTQMDALPTVEGVRAVLEQLNPMVYAEFFRLSVLRMQDVQKPISDRLNIVGGASVSGGGLEVLSAAAGGGEEWAAWTTAFGSGSDVEADRSRGFSGYSRSESGNVSGLERRFGRLTLGIIGAAASGGAQIALPNSKVSSDSWHVGGYASMPLTRRLFADASAFYGETSSVINRTQQLPTGVLSSRAKVFGSEWMVQAGFGMQMAAPGSSWSLVPTVRVAYAGSHQGAAREEGAGAFGIQTDAQSSGTFLLKSGLEGAKEWRMGGVPFRASGNLEWTHDFDIDPRRMGLRWQGESASRWTLSSARGQADTVKLGAALEIGLSDRKTLRIYGSHEFRRSGVTTHMGVSVNIGF
jgi:autotransporter-associated beta strand protein